MTTKISNGIAEFIKSVFPVAYGIKVNVKQKYTRVYFKSEYPIEINFSVLVKLSLFFGTTNIENNIYRDTGRGCRTCGDGSYYEITFIVSPADEESNRLIKLLKEAGYEINA